MFGELEVKTAYSFRHSTVLIPDLVTAAVNKHIEALGITDTNMYGMLEFYNTCTKNHIKPILGLEIQVSIDTESYPMIVYALDDFGYPALVSICNRGSINQEVIEIESLTQYLPHIALVSSHNGMIERLVSKELETIAIEKLNAFKSLFHDSFYVCIQSHDLMLQNKINERIIDLCHLTHIKVLCSNDVRYIESKDALTLDLLKSTETLNTIEVGYIPKTTQKYLKNKEELSSLFTKEILENTEEFISRIHTTIQFNQPLLPKYDVPNNGNSHDYLKQLCIFGLKKRFKNKVISNEYKDRLLYELEVIHHMGFDDYFLVVFDYVKFAKSQGIQVGVGRGSACGSLVAYTLGITNVDPIKYNLLFERFLNPERVSMPDIDIDFQDNRRDEVVEYIVNKYGQEYVCQIVTFSTFGPKVALRDISKVLEIPTQKVELVSKYIPTNLKDRKSLAQLYNSSASLQNIISKDPKLSFIYPSLCLIEFLPRNISMHAAGVVISNSKLSDVIPLTSDNGVVMSQYSKNYIESVGLLKMDLLGLRNLTMLDYMIKDIEQYEHVSINLSELTYDDPKTYKLLSSGDTYGVFQLESPGMIRLLTQLKPTSFKTIVDAIALYRPGPMENIPDYIKYKNHPEKIEYVVDELKPILKDTNGIIIYQEQIMQIAQVLAGFTLAKADILRKAVSKKEGQLLLDMKEEFIQGASTKVSKEKAIEVYNLIEKFANYGFNKAHSVGYAMIAYQLAYIKANYPLYFYSAILSSNGSSNISRIHCISECKARGIQILKPSITLSTDRFMIQDHAILYPLTQIKNVGIANYKSIKSIREMGPFTDIYDFVLRASEVGINIKTIESLIDAGALDEFKISRTMLRNNLDKIKEYGELKNTLGIDEKPILTIYPENHYLVLEREKEVLGQYISTHPIELVKRNYPDINLNISQINQSYSQVEMIVSVSRIKVILDKHGNEMAFLNISDESSHMDAVLFSSSYSQFKSILERNQIYKIKGRLNKKDQLSINITDMIKLEA